MITFLHFPCRPFLIHHDRKKIHIKIAALGSAKEQPLKIELWDYPNNEPAVVEMHQELQTDTFTIYSADIQTDSTYNLQSYVFRIQMPGKDLKWLSSLKLSINEPLESERYNVNLKVSSAEWIQDQSFYQILPDRFASSSISDEDFPKQFEHSEENLKSAHFHGDLKAIKAKIPYIKSLGFTGVYLNPISESTSVLGFDVKDHLSVNNSLGTNQDLVDLITEAHNQSLRVLLDLPSSYISDQHPLFCTNKFTTDSANQNKDSSLRLCFNFEDGKPICSKKDEHLIKLNYSSQKVQDLMFRDKNSALKHYLIKPYNADGLRIVDSHMIGSKGSAYDNHRYLKKIMKEVKEANPECYIMGDHYYDARSWICLNIAQEDGALNIQGFYKPMIQFLSGKDYYSGAELKYKGEDFKACIDRYHCGIPHDMLINMFNIIGNNDTKRISSILGNNPQMIRLALTMMFTWIGVPCVYYGDEIGLSGNTNNDALKPMEWFSTNDIFKKMVLVLSKFRKNCVALRKGALRVTYGDNNLVIYDRSYDSRKIIVIINRGYSVVNADINENLRDLMIQSKVNCHIHEGDDVNSCSIKPENDIKNSIIMDNIRIMPYAELDKSGIIKVGPTSALIIV